MRDGFGRWVVSFFGLEAAELIEGVVVVALGGIDATLEAGKFIALVGVGLGEGDVEDVVGLLPELSLDGAEAAEKPVAVDEGVDEQALVRCGGVEAVVVLVDEFLEVGPDFAADELGFRVDAGFEGIHGGAGFALDGAGSGGFFRVEAIG